MAGATTASEAAAVMRVAGATTTSKPPYASTAWRTAPRSVSLTSATARRSPYRPLIAAAAATAAARRPGGAARATCAPAAARRSATASARSSSAATRNTTPASGSWPARSCGLSRMSGQYSSAAPCASDNDR
ncbi:hypothetical protein ACFQ0B_56685 [Nonomuraea thailandensis]